MANFRSGSEATDGRRCCLCTANDKLSFANVCNSRNECMCACVDERKGKRSVVRKECNKSRSPWRHPCMAHCPALPLVRCQLLARPLGTRMVTEMPAGEKCGAGRTDWVIIFSSHQKDTIIVRATLAWREFSIFFLLSCQNVLSVL